MNYYHLSNSISTNRCHSSNDVKRELSIWAMMQKMHKIAVRVVNTGKCDFVMVDQ